MSDEQSLVLGIGILVVLATFIIVALVYLAGEMLAHIKAEKAKNKQEQELIKSDAYLARLKNSASGYRGHRHSGSGPFLEVEEVSRLIRKELKAKTTKSDV